MQSAVTIQDAKLLISRFWRDLQGVAGRKEEAYVQSLSEWMEVADTKAVELRAASKVSRQIPDTARNVIVFSNTKAQLRRKALRFQENLALNCATSLSIRSDFLDISFADSRIATVHLTNSNHNSPCWPLSSDSLWSSPWGSLQLPKFINPPECSGSHCLLWVFRVFSWGSQNRQPGSADFD